MWFLKAYNKELKCTNARKHVHQSSQPQSVLNVVTEQLAEQMNVLLEAIQSDKITIWNLTTANVALVGTNAGLTNKLDQAFAQISDTQTEIESLKRQKETTSRTTAKSKYNWWSQGYTTSAKHTSLNCLNKNQAIKIGLYLKEEKKEAIKFVMHNLGNLGW